MRRYRFGLLTCALLVTSGCYTYSAVETPLIGSTLRVSVPIDNALTGPNQAPQTASIEGIVVGTGDTLALATQRRQEYGAYREVIQHDTLKLARDRATLMEVREFSAPKSILLGSVLAVGAAVAAVAAFNSGQDGGQTPDPGPGIPAPAFVISGSLVSSFLGVFGLR